MLVLLPFLMPCHYKMTKVLHTDATYRGSWLYVMTIPIGIVWIGTFGKSALKVVDDEVRMIIVAALHDGYVDDCSRGACGMRRDALRIVSGGKKKEECDLVFV